MANLVEIAVKAESELGEGAIWDSDKQLLYWVDILKGKIHSFDPSNGISKTIHTELLVGTVVPKSGGGFAIATSKGFATTDENGENIQFINDPELHLPNNRFNDGKCDPAGRFWAGTMSMIDELGKGSLYCLEKGKLSLKETNVSISNGIVWTADEKTMYYVDTTALAVYRYDYDIHSGNISNRTIALQIPESEGWPDGMTIDADGMLWIAHWGGSQVARWNPATKAKLFSISLPATQITSVAFGGNDLTDIYITSARVGLSVEQLSKEPLAGSLFCIKNSGFKGVKSFEYRG